MLFSYRSGGVKGFNSQMYTDTFSSENIATYPKIREWKKSDKLIIDWSRQESGAVFKLGWTADELSELKQSHKHMVLCVIDWGE